MRALTLWQPWASFMALGIKGIETRSWRTMVRPGEVIAIHAAARPEPDRESGPEWAARRAVHAYRGSFEEAAQTFPLGVVVAVATFDRLIPTECFEPGELSHLEVALGDYSPGRFGWRTSRLAALPEPVPCKGAQRLWRLPDDVASQVVAQANRAGFYHTEAGCI